MRKKAGDDVVTIYLLPPSVKELRKRLEGRGTDSKEVIEKRIGIASSYLPKMMDKQEVVQIISQLPDKSIDAVMKHFKTNFAGKVDMRLVQEVLKEQG